MMLEEVLCSSFRVPFRLRHSLATPGSVRHEERSHTARACVRASRARLCFPVTSMICWRKTPAFRIACIPCVLAVYSQLT